MICNNCPRKCNIDRSKISGVCGVGVLPKVAKAYLHKWEEPCIAGKNGSGTIFFSGCNLKCVYCQNYEISHNAFGKEISINRLVEIIKELESSGATNINFVSPSHYIHAVKEALDIYRPQIPIVYNCSGYEDLKSLELLKEYVDIYLVDFKYFDQNLSKELSNAYDYPDVAKNAIKKMREYQPSEVFDGEIMKKGVIIRHLILPSHTDDSTKILHWIKENIENPFISLMSQYTPMYKANTRMDINRTLKPLEYKLVEKELIKLGLTNGYLQELSSANDSYTPLFDLQGV